MAHVKKFKAVAVAPMVGHYNREAEAKGFVRDNIDPSRTADNYAVGAATPEALADALHLRVGEAKLNHVAAAGKALRKDANVLCDWVVTLPKDCPEGMERTFFESVVSFIQDRYGKENVLGGFVHMDETTPHVHVPVVPVIDGKLQASKMVNRVDLKTFHGDLGKAVDAALGVHVSIELDEQQQGDKQLSHLNQDEYRAAQARLEGLRRDEERLGEEIEELQPAAETVPESARALWTARGDGSREEVLAGDIERLRERISGFEREKASLERECSGLESECRGLEGECRGLRERLDLLRGRVEQLAAGITHTLTNVGERAARVLRSLGIDAYADRPLEVLSRQASMSLKSEVRDSRAASRQLGGDGIGRSAGRGWESR